MEGIFEQLNGIIDTFEIDTSNKHLANKARQLLQKLRDEHNPVHHCCRHCGRVWSDKKNCPHCSSSDIQHF